MPGGDVIPSVTRGEPSAIELLVFDHVGMPEAGIQVPSGMVEIGESFEAAARRELFEETGLRIESEPIFTAHSKHLRDDRNEIHSRHTFRFHLTSLAANEWIHTVSGRGEDRALKFKCYWMPASKARTLLAVGQGDFLGTLG